MQSKTILGKRRQNPLDPKPGDITDVDPLEDFVARETAQQHSAKLDALAKQAKFSSQQQKIVDLLRNEEGLLHPNGDVVAEEVGARLNIPANQVSVQWRRAREKMRKVSGE